jgi:hypothetical protein
MRRIVSAVQADIYHIRRKSRDVRTGFPNSVKAAAYEQKKGGE